MDKDAKEKEARKGRSPMLTSPEALLGQSLLASGYFCLVLAADQGLARKMILARVGVTGVRVRHAKVLYPLLNKSREWARKGKRECE